MKEIFLYNTKNRDIEKFEPLKPGEVSIYSCGPTVYDYAHIGNLRTYIFSDILRRTFEYNSYKVKQVMNITDVGHLISDEDEGEDKIEKAAREKKKTAAELARFFEKAFVEDLKKLNIEMPEVLPRATEHISEMIELIKKLEEKGYTYKTSDGLYFNTRKFKRYGEMARLDLENERKTSRIKENPEKKNPADFALWKFSNPTSSPPCQGGDQRGGRRQMEWDSPWGKGFPGWHIECSAMSMKYLGETFDIHTGGVDHIGTHHTNEIAQSEAVTGEDFAKIFMHGEFLLMEGGKMAKSKGNIVTITDLEKKGFSPLDFRFLCLQAHYRDKLNFTWQSLEAASEGLKKIKNLLQGNFAARKPAAREKDLKNKFAEYINHDLDTPQALSLLFETLKRQNPQAKELALDFDRVFGLSLGKPKKISVPLEIVELSKEREAARQKKDFSGADKIRKKIEEAGFVVEDTKDGPQINPK